MLHVNTLNDLSISGLAQVYAVWLIAIGFYVALFTLNFRKSIVLGLHGAFSFILARYAIVAPILTISTITVSAAITVYLIYKFQREDVLLIYKELKKFKNKSKEL